MFEEQETQVIGRGRLVSLDLEHLLVELFRALPIVTPLFERTKSKVETHVRGVFANGLIVGASSLILLASGVLYLSQEKAGVDIVLIKFHSVLQGALRFRSFVGI